MQESTSDSPSLSNSSGAKPQRKDVVMKTVLRKIRKYFLAQFNTETEYIHMKKAKGRRDHFLKKLGEWLDLVRVEHP